MTKLMKVTARDVRFASIVALHAFLPFAIAATILYPQPHSSLITVGKLSHVISLFCAFVACAVLARHPISKAVIILGFPVAYIFSFVFAIEEIRTVYLVILMYMFFLVGLALIQINASYVR